MRSASERRSERAAACMCRELRAWGARGSLRARRSAQHAAPGAPLFAARFLGRRAAGRAPGRTPRGPAPRPRCICRSAPWRVWSGPAGCLRGWTQNSTHAATTPRQAATSSCWRWPHSKAAGSCPCGPGRWASEAGCRGCAAPAAAPRWCSWRDRTARPRRGAARRARGAPRRESRRAARAPGRAREGKTTLPLVSWQKCRTTAAKRGAALRNRAQGGKDTR